MKCILQLLFTTAAVILGDDNGRTSPTLISGAVGSIGARTSNQKFSKGPIKKHHARVPKCTKSLLTKKNTKNMIPSNTRATVPN